MKFVKRTAFFFAILLLACTFWSCAGTAFVPLTEPERTTADDTHKKETSAPVQSDPAQSDPGTKTDPALPPDSSFAVHFIDVGQADCSLVLCDGHAMLIDGGNKGDSNLVYRYLKEQGIETLDIVICTHAHEDHVGGLAGALNAATAKAAYCPVTQYGSDAFGNFTKYLQKQNVALQQPVPGETFMLGSAQCTVLGPITVTPDTDPNNTSIVLRVQYGETVFLFTGDAETEEEHEILDAGYDVSCTVLKVGHHGSDSSTSYPFLRAAMPQYAVISVGQDNSYEHPCEATISKLRDADVRTFRTDMQGHIVCRSDGKTVTVTPSRNADINTLVPAGAGGNHTDSGITTEDAVWITSSGKRYHITPDCSGMKKPIAVSEDEAIARGYTACPKCCAKE